VVKVCQGFTVQRLPGILGPQLLPKFSQGEKAEEKMEGKGVRRGTVIGTTGINR
jgi:hypothetical protein